MKLPVGLIFLCSFFVYYLIIQAKHNACKNGKIFLGVFKMVKIDGFNGISYNINKFNSIKDLVAPPYDVISPQYQEVLYNRNPNNVIRLILGKTFEADNDSNNRYTRAAVDYHKWLEEGVLVKSDKPKMYYYVQKYTDAKGIDVSRKGFIARCYLEEFSAGKVLPHEETMGGPKKDRMGIMEAAKANFSPIFSIYSDPQKQIEEIMDNCCTGKPFDDVLDDDGVRHIFYEVSDASIIDKIKNIMAEKTVLIADGHHRYETALQYRNNKREEEKADSASEKLYDYVLMYFANLDEEGLRVYPTHRLLRKSLGSNLNDLIGKLKPYFEVKEVKFTNFDECYKQMSSEPISDIPIGFVSKENQGVLYVIKPCKEKVKEELVKHNVPDLLGKLDVAILHKFILETLLGLDTLELKNQNNIEFIRDEAELKEKYEKNMAEIIFLLNTPDVPTIKEICLSGLRMPQKTTYFYPKLLSGLVVNPLA